ncbi:MAG: polysaccharide deacetylase family protein [Candidatus Borkfalkiaceae bacterium]|nr:polysaccharide deacetylase family protein [Clostridia bacterium]MDY6222751.1 polysaccharide deacetylase family protein [Christensenellaceae bacterium]
MSIDFLRFPNFKRKAVTLSYDDGVKWDKQLIEIMVKNGLKGTFNLNSGRFALKDGERKLTAQAALELYEGNGMEVAAHGQDHLSLAKVSSVMAVNDIISDRKTLEKLFRKPIVGWAYANGSYCTGVAEMLKTCGTLYARTTISTEKFDLPGDWLRWPTTCHHGNARLMELAREFVEQKDDTNFWRNRPQLFYLWGHSYEFNDHNNWYIIEEFAEYVGNREDIWYATNVEIYDYIEAYYALRFGAEGTFVFNPTCIDIYLEYYGQKVVVPAGKLVDLPERRP